MCDVRDNIVSEVPHIRRFALSLVGPSREYDADDLVQESIEKALKQAHTFQGGTNLRGWLFTITRNTFLSGKRRDSVKARYAREQMASGDETVDAPQNIQLMLEQTAAALRSFPAKERETLIELAVLERPQAAIARRYREPIGTVKSRLSRTRAKLRKHLGGMSAEAVSALAA